jgi:hypothetical protein
MIWVNTGIGHILWLPLLFLVSLSLLFPFEGADGDEEDDDGPDGEYE